MRMKMKMASCLFSTTVLILVLVLSCCPIGTMGFTMKLIPRDHIDQVLFPKNLTLVEKHHRIAQLSKTRALQYFMTNDANPEALQPGVRNVFTSIYAVEMTIGTKPFSTYLLMDTGADDTWVQCYTCKKCFPLVGGNFNFHESKTSKIVSCNDPLCVPKLCSSADTCLYRELYAGGGAISSGIVLSENFTFPDHSQGSGYVSFLGVVFGCGDYNQNIRFGKPMLDDNVIGGIFGLGSGPRSFLRQLARATNMRFSYCLASASRAGGGPLQSSYLRFGPDATISGNFKTTPLVTLIPQLTRYYVVCTGISLFGTRLPIDPALLRIKPDGTGGFVFDTGASSAVLVKSAYQVLKAHVIAYFEQRYHLRPFTERKMPYGLCYEEKGGPIGYIKPSMTYHFQGEGAPDLVLGPNSVFQYFRDGQRGFFCLAATPSSDDRVPNIVGAYNMVDHLFLFDVGKNEVSFVPQTCTTTQ